jgi:hypothetical protein
MVRHDAAKGRRESNGDCTGINIGAFGQRTAAQGLIVWKNSIFRVDHN